MTLIPTSQMSIKVYVSRPLDCAMLCKTAHGPVFYWSYGHRVAFIAVIITTSNGKHLLFHFACPSNHQGGECSSRGTREGLYVPLIIVTNHPDTSMCPLAIVRSNLRDSVVQQEETNLLYLVISCTRGWPNSPQPCGRPIVSMELDWHM